MSYRKPWTARILNAASKENRVDARTLRNRLRIPGTAMDSFEFDNTIGRTMRHLAEQKYLKRTARGEFKITKKGEKAVYSY